MRVSTRVKSTPQSQQQRLKEQSANKLSRKTLVESKSHIGAPARQSDPATTLSWTLPEQRDTLFMCILHVADKSVGADTYGRGSGYY